MNIRTSPRRLCAAMAALLMLLPPARADIVTTEQLLDPAATEADRAQVKAFVERAAVADKLQALGVDSASVGERVDAMSAEEIRMLARNIERLPAGGDFTTTEIVIGALLVILLLALVL